MILHNHADYFKELIVTTANALSLPAIYVEKDYYVTRLLNNLSYSAYKDSLVFKGGTSLSKAYHLISRFSEDIDLAVCIEGLSEHKLKKLMKASEKTITEGFHYVPHVLESKRGAIRKTYYGYSKNYDDDFGQVSQHILLEINCFARPFPHSLHNIQSLISEFLLREEKHELIEQFCLAPFELNVLDVERTVAEKIMALVKVIGLSNSANIYEQLEHKIRHIYDLCMIANHPDYSSLFASDKLLNLIKDVRQHDEERSPGDRAWLTLELSDIALFSKPENYLKSIKQSMTGNFTQLVYADELPNDQLILNTLFQIHHLLLKCAN